MEIRVAVSFGVLLCFFVLPVQGQYDETHAASLTEQFLNSPGYQYGSLYQPNQTWTYLVTTSYPNHTVLLRVDDCEMEADKNGLCYYDKLLIYDGADNTSAELSEFCCSTVTLPTFQSSGDRIYLIFTSDGTNEFKGFRIGYVSDGPTTTTSTTTVAPPTTTTTATPVQNSDGGGGGSGINIWIIIGCVIGGLLLIVLLIVAICCFMKSKRPTSPTDASKNDTKRILWSRGATMVQPMDAAKTALPPGTVTQTNIFDMELPESGRGNQLPPLSALYPPEK